MRRSGARRLVLGLAALVGSTGFATCGGETPGDGKAPESAAEATIEEEQEDMYRDIDR